MTCGSRQTFWSGSTLLPVRFQQLDFVNANGSQWSGDSKPLNNSAYINTGIIPSTNIRVYSNIIYKKQSGLFQTFMGSTSYALNKWPLWTIRNNNSNVFSDFTTPNEQHHIELNVQITDYELNIEFDAHRLKVNDQLATSSQQVDYTETHNYPIIIGGMYFYVSSVGARAGAIALYKQTTFVDLQTNEVLGDFIPAKDKSTLICGFYDIVKKQFHSSLNSIPFTENGF